MPLFAIQRPGAQVGLRGEALEVHHSGERLLVRPLHTVDEVHLYGDIELSARARDALLRQGVEVLLLTPTGRLLGRITPPESRGAQRRSAQHAVLSQPDRVRALAAHVVHSKLINQRALIVRLLRAHPDQLDPGVAIALARLAHRTTTTDDLDALRGLEGQGAALYFRALGQAVRVPEMTFTLRSRRPPRDAFNACLSFGYTLLGARVEASVRRAGLDAGLGALHTPAANRASLALDLMEPYRVLVDRLVLSLVNRRALSPQDFEHPAAHDEPLSAPLEPGDPPEPAPPAVHLGPNGRPVFLRALAELWRTPFDHPERTGRFVLDDLIDHHVLGMAAWFEGLRPDLPSIFVLR